jgi:TetR/AcrR family fatty acid metabolism transcriptional regulator
MLQWPSTDHAVISLNGRVALPRRTKSDVVSDFRRAQILEAARQSFARHGLNGTTVDQIARAARVAKGTVYLYYRSKEDLLQHALNEGLAALHAATVPRLAAAEPLEEKLRRFFTGTLDYFDRNREFIELCQVELGAEMRRKARRTFGRIYAAQARAWQTALEAAARDGAIGRTDAPHAALLIVSLAHGLAIQRLRGWTKRPLEDDVALASALLLKGLSVR